MHFLQPLLFATAAAAFTIPHGQPQGAYTVRSVNGEEVHHPARDILGDASPPPVQRSSSSDNSDLALSKRAGATCAGDNLNPGDTDAAVNDLILQCNKAGKGNRGVGPGLSFYSIRGCTVAYVCNFETPNPFSDGYVCKGDSVPHGLRDVTAACGRYRSGWSQQGVISIGYENVCKSPGSNFCGHGR